MANKAPKKKESREQVNQTQTKEANVGSFLADNSAGKRKPPIPLWVEWNEQDISNEKWDNGKQQKDRGRSPTATSSCFEDTEGKIDLPPTIKCKVHSWKRPCEIINESIPTVVSVDYLCEQQIDLLTPNEHLTDSELIRHILSAFTSLYEVFSIPHEPEAVLSNIKLKTTISKDNKDVKVEKWKKDEYVDEMGWKPWHQIWPKEGAKGNNPCYNPQGKYAVKIFWMGCYRKILVDDFIPCDENGNPLLPMTTRGNEIWAIILAKALIKVASLDYYGGLSSSEFGDSNVFHCLTGWLPESIPVQSQNSDAIWNLLLSLLPNWKLPLPKCDRESKASWNKIKTEVFEVDLPVKQELLPKESKDKDKTKKEDKNKDDKKVKTNEKPDKDKINKEKPLTPATGYHCSRKAEPPTPDYLIFATFLNPPASDPPCKFSDYKRMANISEKLRQFGLCQYLSHPVCLNSVRVCPLLPHPEPLKIPRWRLIRQRRNREIVEPKLRPEQEAKDPKCLQLKSMFFNFNVKVPESSSPVSKKKSLTKIPSISEENSGNGDVSQTKNNSETVNPSHVSPDVHDTEHNISSADVEVPRKINRSPSVTSSQSSQMRKGSKSKDMRRSAQKDRNSFEKKGSASRNSFDIPPPSDDIPDIMMSEGSVMDIPTAYELDSDQHKENDGGKEALVWIDWDDFLMCFGTLWIYHKPKKNTKNITDIQCLEQKSDKARKSAAHNVADFKNIPSLFSGSCGTADTLPPLLVVDCVHKAEILFHFSSLSRWFNPNVKLLTKREVQPEMSKSIPGTLMVEPYFWKQIVTPSPLLRLSTTGVKAAILTLPPGRHVLRFMVNTPIGYHICISSSQNFIFDGEHEVIQHLTKVSARYISHAVDVLEQLKLISQGFHDKSITRNGDFQIGTEDKPSNVRRQHFDSLHNCLAIILQMELGDSFQSKMKFTLNALKFESYFHIPKIYAEKQVLRSKSAPTSTSDIPKIQGRFSLPAMYTFTVPEAHVIAATKIQSTFKGYYIRKLVQAYLPDSKENKIVNEMFDKIWSVIDINIESFAIKLYMRLFEEKPNLYALFPFYSDQENEVSYCDYNGSYFEPSNPSWFLLFREIFYALDNELIFPKLYCSLQNYQLKIINNDTKEELKSLFSKVVPQLLAKNKHGYTFVATGWHHSYVPSGKFRLRIIGARDTLPIPVKENYVTTNFITKEVKDYYMPNRYCRIFRQTVKVNEDVLSSIQFLTSKDDVCIRLNVLDTEDVIYSCEGKRMLVIPSQIFYKDRIPPDESNKSRSSSQAGSVTSISKSSKQGTRNSSPEKNKKRLLQLADFNMEEDVIEEEIHKYIVEAFVIQDTWPLTRKEWVFVENHKNAEKLVDKEVSSDSVTKNEQPASRGSAGKSRKNARQDSRATKNRPPSQTQNSFDSSKAHWILRFIIDANMEDAIEVKSDTQREEEIKAIKAAWETVEPGRLAKALLSRQKYLESHTVDVDPPLDVNKEEESIADDRSNEKNEEEIHPSVLPASERVVSESPLPSEPDTGELFHTPPMKENVPILTKLDVIPFIRSNGKKVILDEMEEERRQGILQNKFSSYHQIRELVLQKRSNSRISRNIEKEKQVAEYEKMQIQLDKTRFELYQARESYRNKFMPQLLTEPEADIERNPSPKKSKSKSKKK